MNLGDAFHRQFLDGKLEPAQYISLLLKLKQNKLADFLLKEFAKKKCKFDRSRWEKYGRTLIYKGGKHEWYFLDQRRASPYKDGETDYILPLARDLAIAAIEKTPKKTR